MITPNMNYSALNNIFDGLAQIKSRFHEPGRNRQLPNDDSMIAARKEVKDERAQPIFTYLRKNRGNRKLRENRKTQSEKIKNRIRRGLDREFFPESLGRKVRLPPARR
jgi:predicted RNA-binding protein (virulence factor B family)